MNDMILDLHGGMATFLSRLLCNPINEGIGYDMGLNRLGMEIQSHSLRWTFDYSETVLVPNVDRLPDLQIGRERTKSYWRNDVEREDENKTSNKTTRQSI